MVCLKSCRQEKKSMMHQDSLEPAAIRFMLEWLTGVCQAIRLFSPCFLQCSIWIVGAYNITAIKSDMQSIDMQWCACRHVFDTVVENAAVNINYLVEFELPSSRFWKREREWPGGPIESWQASANQVTKHVHCGYWVYLCIYHLNFGIVPFWWKR